MGREVTDYSFRRAGRKRAWGEGDARERGVRVRDADTCNERGAPTFAFSGSARGDLCTNSKPKSDFQKN